MPIDNTPVHVGFAKSVVKDIKDLGKKFRSVRKDINSLVAQLENGETPGDGITDTGFDVYKVRLANSDTNKGKSNGYRVIYYVRTKTEVILLAAYSKKDDESIPKPEVKALVNKYLTEKKATPTE